jgi:pimeloyl-ACP methyl ester carboxylesterase
MKKWLKCIAAVSLVCLLLLVAGSGYFVYLVKSRTPGNFFDSNGFKIYYTDEGHGEPVILIHGLAANADINWRRAGITGELAKHFRVVAMDIRGHGLSGASHDPGDYGMEMIRDVFRLMDHLKIERAHLAGYSLGGFITLKCVAEHPERVISAAYCASGWKDPEGPEDILNPYRKPQREQSAGAAEMDALFDLLLPPTPQGRPGPYAIVPAANDRFLSGPVDVLKRWIGDSIVDRQSVKAMKKAFRDFIVTREELAKMKTPGICFIGTNDGLYPYADDLHRVQPGVELVVLEGANHITTVLRPEFRRGLLQFFEAHRTAPAPAEGK